MDHRHDRWRPKTFRHRTVELVGYGRQEETSEFGSLQVNFENLNCYSIHAAELGGKTYFATWLTPLSSHVKWEAFGPFIHPWHQPSTGEQIRSEIEEWMEWMTRNGSVLQEKWRLIARWKFASFIELPTSMPSKCGKALLARHTALEGDARVILDPSRNSNWTWTFRAKATKKCKF